VVAVDSNILVFSDNERDANGAVQQCRYYGGVLATTNNPIVNKTITEALGIYVQGRQVNII